MTLIKKTKQKKKPTIYRPKADPGNPPPRLKEKMGLVFIVYKHNQYFDFSQHARSVNNMYIIHFSSNKNIGYV